jgi:hypothetical protein
VTAYILRRDMAERASMSFAVVYRTAQLLHFDGPTRERRRSEHARAPKNLTSHCWKKVSTCEDWDID